MYKNHRDFIMKLKNGNRNHANIHSVNRKPKHKNHRNSHIPEKITRHYFPRVNPHPLDFNNRRQFMNVSGISLATELIFVIFILIILFIAGFYMGYNFSINRSSSSYDTEEYGTRHVITNTENNTFATSSNSSVRNTNNDADTITNTVSSG